MGKLLHDHRQRTDTIEASYISGEPTDAMCVYAFTVSGEKQEITVRCEYSPETSTPLPTITVAYDPNNISNVQESDYSLTEITWLLAIPVELLLFFGSFVSFKAIRETRTL